MAIPKVVRWRRARMLAVAMLACSVWTGSESSASQEPVDPPVAPAAKVAASARPKVVMLNSSKYPVTLFVAGKTSILDADNALTLDAKKLPASD